MRTIKERLKGFSEKVLDLFTQVDIHELINWPPEYEPPKFDLTYAYNPKGLLTTKGHMKVEEVDGKLVIVCEFKDLTDLEEFKANLVRHGIKINEGGG